MMVIICYYDGYDDGKMNLFWWLLWIISFCIMVIICCYYLSLEWRSYVTWFSSSYSQLFGSGWVSNGERQPASVPDVSIRFISSQTVNLPLSCRLENWIITFLVQTWFNHGCWPKKGGSIHGDTATTPCQVRHYDHMFDHLPLTAIYLAQEGPLFLE